MEPGTGDLEPLAAFEVDGCDVVALIEAGHYGEIAELLSRRRSAVLHDDSQVSQHLIQAVGSICQACAQCRAEAERLRRADDEVQRRERVLGRELLGLMALLIGAAQPRVPFTATPSKPSRGELQPLADVSRMGDGGVPSASGIDVSVSDSPLPEFTVCCLGPFQFYRGAQALNGWSNGKAKSLFKYLLAHRTHPTPKEVLMDVFWPSAPPHAARNSLNVAIYGLRHALANAGVGCPLVLYEDDCYLINPELVLWLDSEAFTKQVEAAQACEHCGDAAGAVRAYRAAESLYQGEFFADDRYDDWIVPLRESLSVDYRRLLNYLCHHYSESADYDACIAVAHKGLAVDDCDETLHRELMRCYSRRGLHHLAHRQYHLCASALERELDAGPCMDTVALLERIRRQQAV